jgi:2'-5' RNA ligase
MNQQLDLFRTPEPAPLKYGVYLAIFPDPFTADHISAQAAGIWKRHGLHGQLRPTHHLHISLHPLGGYSVVPYKILPFVAEICKAATANISPFKIKLDRALSFRGGVERRPVVLINHSDGNAALTELYQAIGTELSKHLRYRRNFRFNPHLTLLYDQQSIPEETIDPISWKVNEVVLVCSEVDATKHERLGCWELGGCSN